MNERLHELAFVLDESSSIADKLEQAEKNLRKLLKKQTLEEIQTNITVTIFGGDYQKLYDNVPIEKVNLDSERIKPSGVCPAIDALYKTVYDVGERLSNTPEEERPAKVIVVLVVFGRDNASKKHTYDELREYIAAQTNIYKWQFFLATDFTRNMEKLGISEENTFIFHHDDENMFQTVYDELSNRLLECRLPKVEKTAE